MHIECGKYKQRRHICGTPCHPPPATCAILLIAVNARYSHSSYAIRTLKANLDELEHECELFETDLTANALQIAARISESNPLIAGFTVYLWNIRLIEAAARILRVTSPHIRLVAGGPELTVAYSNAGLFDLCIIGEGEAAFTEYCRAVLSQTASSETASRIVATPPVNTADLKLPGHLYTDDDIANRVIYVEASRGCPYPCRYCTSASTGLRTVPLEKLLAELDGLWRRGVRQFKFLDRSFTAAQAHARAVMAFLKERITAETVLHFEINTERVDDTTLQMIAEFPQGTLHLECGIQTLNATVARKIGRTPDIGRTLANLRFLVNQTGADVHADLIFGLPGEDERSFAKGFNTLLEHCAPPVVQLNLLKGLPGTQLAERAGHYRLKFNPEPPYELLESECMDFNTLMRIQRTARCWELVYNRGQMAEQSRALLRLSRDIYGTFTRLADHIYAAEGRLHNVARARLKALVDEFLTL